MSTKILLGIFTGGAVGWILNDSYEILKRKNGNDFYNVQKDLSRKWSSSYQPTVWYRNWDGREKEYREKKQEAFLLKEQIKDNLENEEKRKNYENKPLRRTSSQSFSNNDKSEQKLQSKENQSTNKPINQSTETNSIIQPTNHSTGNKSINQSVDINNIIVPIKYPTTTRNLFFVRHGQYNSEAPNDEYRNLTETGIEQSIVTGKELAESGIPFSRLVVSTMTRAKQTADLINNELKNYNLRPEETHLLREGAPFPPLPPLASWSPTPQDNLDKEKMRKMKKKKKRKIVQFKEDGERIEQAFESYIHRADASQSVDSYELFVCHANVIRYFVCRALQIPPEVWLRFSLTHASITWICIRPSGLVTLRALGNYGHLPYDLRTIS